MKICTISLLVLIIILAITIDAAAPTKTKAAAVPKAKKSKKSGSVFPKLSGFGIFGKVMREAKSAFCSELEALTLKMTRPDSTAIVTTQIGTL